jgi:hypothetical protein
MFLNDLHNRLQPTATLVNIPNPPEQVTCKRPAPQRRLLDAVNSTCTKVQKFKHDLNDKGIVTTSLWLIYLIFINAFYFVAVHSVKGLCTAGFF